MSFLRYIIESGQVKADPEKIRPVAERPTPTSRKQLQRFLGFYRRFINNFSRIVAPLTRLTSSSLSFTWTPEAEQAFSNLKSLFTPASVLVQPDRSLQFMVEVCAAEQMMLVSGICLRSRWRWRNGGTGWRGHSWFGLIIRIHTDC